MTHKTRGIVLRAIKYGETSLIVSVYTELFGLQTYMVNGVRTSSARGPGKANLFQPAAMLDLVVYHNELKNMQRIREFKWAYLYRHLYSDILKNTVALFMVELLQKCLKQPEPNIDLYHFVEDAFLYLDESGKGAVANYPLFFSLHLTGFFGFRIQDDFSPQDAVLDLQEGLFVHELPLHPHFLEGQYCYTTSQLLKVMQPEELQQIHLNQEMRRILLQAVHTFYALHIPDFGKMKSLPVLEAVLS